MAHARLSIIDLSAASDQPFTSHDGRFTIVYNGEIFNYKKLKEELKAKGQSFFTEGDVEVLIGLYREFGKDCLQKINGFFSFLIHDKQQNIFFAARDRFGVKPFYYFADADYFACASELRALKNITGKNSIDKTALYTYLQLTYTPERACILREIKKLEPGHYLLIENKKVTAEKYYEAHLPSVYEKIQDAEKKFLLLLESAVEARLVADVPVGSFLSGGIDSSVITAVAAQQNPRLQTFSIGFKGNKHFDESIYAEAVAKKYKTDHHTFFLDENEIENELENFLDSIDEPFADSSALNVFILAKKTKPFVKVVLSGDGADELFAGYNKHRAEWIIRHQKAKTLFLKRSASVSRLVPSSRNSKLANTARQLQRFSNGAKLDPKERYWRWASFFEEKEVKKLVALSKDEDSTFHSIRNFYCQEICDDFNSVLLSDLRLVLPSDMLVKADRMSMAHGLEVRNPFLDYRMVEFAFKLSADDKIDRAIQKKIIKKSCAHLLPGEILNRKKHGFETPVQHWLRGVLKKKVDELCLDKEFIEEQKLFDHAKLTSLVQQAYSQNAGDATAAVWSVLIFNHWYKKNIL